MGQVGLYYTFGGDSALDGKRMSISTQCLRTC